MDVLIVLLCAGIALWLGRHLYICYRRGAVTWRDRTSLFLVRRSYSREAEPFDYWWIMTALAAVMAFFALTALSQILR